MMVPRQVAPVAFYRSPRSRRLYAIVEGPQPGAPATGPLARLRIEALPVIVDPDGQIRGGEVRDNMPSLLAKVIDPLDWARMRLRIYDSLIAQVEGIGTDG